MTNVLVTGAYGQLASCIEDLIPKHKDINFIFKGAQDLDITDKLAVGRFFNETSIDYCINCAAYTAVDKAESDHDLATRINVKGAAILADACKRSNAVLIHISTDYVFDGNQNRPYLETDDTAPLGVYGRTKLLGELAVAEAIDQHIILRTSWLYSEHGNNFMITMLRLSNSRKELNIVNDQIGSPTYAKDLAETIIKIIKSKSENYGVFHYCNQGITSRYDFAKAIFDHAGSEIQINAIPSHEYKTAAERPKYSALNTSKLSQTFKIDVPDWKDGLNRCYNNFVRKKHLKVAINAALEAGASIMDVYDSDYLIEEKEDKSPLTIADKNANAIINLHLAPTEVPIISEENKQIAYNMRSDWSLCWIVDPVDGTKEFIKRNGEFTVNIALIEEAKPVLGVIYVPASKLLYFADVNQDLAYKCQLTKHDTSLETIHTSKQRLNPSRNKTDHLRIVGSRSHMNAETLSFVDSLKAAGKTVDIVSKGSSLKFCLIAEGNADIYPRFAPTMEWDTAAGQAICNAVGVQVINQETDEPLLYNKENLLNPWFLVTFQ